MATASLMSDPETEMLPFGVENRRPFYKSRGIRGREIRERYIFSIESIFRRILCDGILKASTIVVKRRTRLQRKKKEKKDGKRKKGGQDYADPHEFLRATRETEVDKRRAQPAVINYETFAAVGNSNEKKKERKKIVPCRIYSSDGSRG